MGRESSIEAKQSSVRLKKEKESNSTVSGSNLKKDKDSNKLRELSCNLLTIQSYLNISICVSDEFFYSS